MIGSVLWGIFAKSLSGVMQGFSSGSVFVKIKCSPLAFSISGLSQVFFDLLLQCMLLIPAFLLFDINFSPSILLVPLGMLGLSLLGSALVLLFIPISSFYH